MSRAARTAKGDFQDFRLRGDKFPIRNKYNRCMKVM